MAEETKERGLVEYQSRDGQAIKLSFDTVRKFLVSGKAALVTDQEIVMYMGMCKARGLNPFKRDCYLVKYTEKTPAATIVSIDYYRSRARAQADCLGWESGVIALDKDQVLQFRRGSFMYPGDELKGGWFRAKPKDWTIPFEWSVNLEPFIKKTADGDITTFWREENQPQQIAKVAESQGLRRLWPDEFQGLYTEGEELDLRDVTPIGEPLAKPKEVESDELVKNPSAEKSVESNDTRVPSGGVGGGEAPESSSKPSTRNQPGNAGDANKDRDKKAEALAWVGEAPEAEIMDTKTLSVKLKGLTQGEQLVVCSAFNKRRNQIVEDLKQSGGE